jgi:hypothetical protein
MKVDVNACGESTKVNTDNLTDGVKTMMMIMMMMTGKTMKIGMLIVMKMKLKETENAGILKKVVKMIVMILVHNASTIIMIRT